MVEGLLEIEFWVLGVYWFHLLIPCRILQVHVTEKFSTRSLKPLTFTLGSKPKPEAPSPNPKALNLKP